VIKSDIFQLNQRREEDRYVHVIAFITHQYYRLQDNLVLFQQMIEKGFVAQIN